VNDVTGRHLPFDMIIHPLRIIVEVDGEQHYREVKYFKVTLEFTQARDKLKEEKANNKGHSVIRMDQVEVMKKSSVKWQQKLVDAIEEVKEMKPCVRKLYAK